MIRNILGTQRLSSLAAKLLVVCVIVDYYPHTGHASVPDVQQLQVKAQKGFIAQQIELAEAYFTGEGVAQDVKQAAYWFQKAAEAGNPEAQNLVGYLYEAGVGVPADPARALHWYQLAAASGSSDATLNIGVLYVLGLGVKKDVPTAAEYFHKAVDRGNGTGASYLGTLNYAGIGMRQDMAAAERWYTLGQKMNDPISTYNLGSLYSTAPDHPHDAAKAAGYLRQSAETGYVPAIHSLALLMIHHPEFAKSPQESQHLLEYAASAGYWRSSLLLGVLARDGNGMPVDPKLAYYHFRVAIQQGGKTAQGLLNFDINRLTATLGTKQIEAIDADANSWVEQHHLTRAFVHTQGGSKKFFSEATRPDLADLLHAGLTYSNPAS
jgi:TPR repeat protein